MIREVSVDELTLITPHRWTWDEKPVRCWATFENREIVCGLRIFERSLVYGQVCLPVAGIGGLITDPSHRGQGLASKLIHFVCNNEDPREFVGFIANSIASESVFHTCGFIPIGLSVSHDKHSLYWKSMADVVLVGEDTFDVLPEVHF